MRLRLKPGLLRIDRGPTTVQIGADPRHGVVVDGVTAADRALLDALTDGLTLPQDEIVLDGGKDPGPFATPRAHQLIVLLTQAGVLQRSTPAAERGPTDAIGLRLIPDAATWAVAHGGPSDGWRVLADRRHRSVEIRGSDRTGLCLAATLAAAGVGAVHVVDPAITTPAEVTPGGARPEDVGCPRQQTAAALVAPYLSPLDLPGSSGDPPPASGEPDLVVLVSRAAVDPTAADPLLAADRVHLSVVVHETSVVVGPLVFPGQGPCLRCLDLHRADRDPQWPRVLAQLLTASATRVAPRAETATAQLAASLAALQVLGHLDGRRPAAVGATLAVELPDGLTSRRPWPTHPDCGCHWPPAARRFSARTPGAAASEQ